MEGIEEPEAQIVERLSPGSEVDDSVFERDRHLAVGEVGEEERLARTGPAGDLDRATRADGTEGLRRLILAVEERRVGPRQEPYRTLGLSEGDHPLLEDVSKPTVGNVGLVLVDVLPGGHHPGDVAANVDDDVGFGRRLGHGVVHGPIPSASTRKIEEASTPSRVTSFGVSASPRAARSISFCPKANAVAMLLP